VKRRYAHTAAAWCLVVFVSFVPAAGPARAQWLLPQADPAYPRIQYSQEKSDISLNDRCMVKRNKLSIEVRPVWVNGRPAAFCCTPCVEAFSARPEVFLPTHGIQLYDPVNPQRKAVIDEAHRVNVNYEIFFFASADAAKRFRANPIRWSGLLTDPVTQSRFQPDENSTHMLYKGRPYYFSEPASRDSFAADPGRYALRKGK
jgi:YHS domain-containing protein